MNGSDPRRPQGPTSLDVREAERAPTAGPPAVLPHVEPTEETTGVGRLLADPPLDWTTRAAPRPERRAPDRGLDVADQRAMRNRLAGFAGRLALVLVLSWGLLFNFSEVRGSSMEPGIHDRDRILVDHFSYLFSTVERGDVVVLQYPLDPNLDYLKRVIGLPGDEVRVSKGTVWVNGQRLDEPYLDIESIDPFSAHQCTVRPDHVYVLGDNRLRSSDSREFGQVPVANLRGKVRARIWPPSRVGLVD